jgi:hypothetical protein
MLTISTRAEKPHLELRLIVERADKRRDFHGRFGSYAAPEAGAVSHENAGLALAATLKTPLDMSTRASRPIQIYAFGRSISPALCGMFPGLEYVFTIDG